MSTSDYFRNQLKKLKTIENPETLSKTQKLKRHLQESEYKYSGSFSEIFEDSDEVNELEEAYPDNFDAKAYDRYWGTDDDELYNKLVDELKGEAHRFDLRGYSKDPDDFEGELDGILDNLIHELKIYVDEQDENLFYELIPELQSAASEIIAPKLRKHMGIRTESFGKRGQATGVNAVQNALNYVMKMLGPSQWASTNDIISNAAKKFGVDPDTISRSLQQSTQFQKLNQSMYENEYDNKRKELVKLVTSYNNFAATAHRQEMRGNRRYHATYRKAEQLARQIEKIIPGLEAELSAYDTSSPAAFVNAWFPKGPEGSLEDPYISEDEDKAVCECGPNCKCGGTCGGKCGDENCPCECGERTGVGVNECGISPR